MLVFRETEARGGGDLTKSPCNAGSEPWSDLKPGRRAPVHWGQAGQGLAVRAQSPQPALLICPSLVLEGRGGGQGAQSVLGPDLLLGPECCVRPMGVPTPNKYRAPSQP